MSQQTKVVTGINTRLSYANIWEPKSINGGKEKYSVSLIIPPLRKPLMPPFKKALEDLAVRNQTRLLSSFPYVMAMLNEMMKHIKTVTSLTLTPSRPHKSWTNMSSPFSTAMKFTAAAMLGYQSTSTPLIPMAIAELPVGLATFKRFGMVSR